MGIMMARINIKLIPFLLETMSIIEKNSNKVDYMENQTQKQRLQLDKLLNIQRLSCSIPDIIKNSGKHNPHSRIRFRDILCLKALISKSTSTNNAPLLGISPKVCISSILYF